MKSTIKKKNPTPELAVAGTLLSAVALSASGADKPNIRFIYEVKT